MVNDLNGGSSIELLMKYKLLYKIYKPTLNVLLKVCFLYYIYFRFTIFISILRYLFPFYDIYFHFTTFISILRYLFPFYDIYFFFTIFISVLRYLFPYIFKQFN